MKRYISSGRLDNISNWRSREDQRLVDEANAKQTKLDQMVSQVRALRPRIQEILETANAASEAGIPLAGRGSYAKGTDANYFEAEGIYHRVGVYPDWKLGGGPHNRGRPPSMTRADRKSWKGTYLYSKNHKPYLSVETCHI